VKGRAERLIDLLPEAGLDLLLVTDLINVRYLTGYTGSNGLALIGPQTRVFITDFRYVEQAAAEVHPSYERRQAPLDLVDALAQALPPGELVLGFEDSQLTVRQHERVRELLPERARLAAAGTLVERLRAVKEPEEIARITAAIEIADAAFQALLEHGLRGRTERQVARVLEDEIRARGATPSFDTIVAAGPRGALPHAKPGDTEIAPGELIVIDWGAQLDGYCSDCTRTVVVGEADIHAREVYELVLRAQLAGLHAVKPAAGGREVDSIARALIETGGHGERFGHGLGHGVGLAIHEAPRLSQRSQDILQIGNVVTVEPGVYVPGSFGVRIEDLVVVSTGGREILTTVTKELLSLD
jgi:Xaa-Pro aminopeptidase